MIARLGFRVSEASANSRCANCRRPVLCRVELKEGDCILCRDCMYIGVLRVPEQVQPLWVAPEMAQLARRRNLWADAIGVAVPLPPELTAGKNSNN